MKNTKSNVFFTFVIIAIIAMIAMKSIINGLGFALSIFIIIISLMCIISMIYLLCEMKEKIKEKERIGAIGNLILAVILAIIGLKIFFWLMEVLF